MPVCARLRSFCNTTGIALLNGSRLYVPCNATFNKGAINLKSLNQNVSIYFDITAFGNTVFIENLIVNLGFFLYE